MSYITDKLDEFSSNRSKEIDVYKFIDFEYKEEIPYELLQESCLRYILSKKFDTKNFSYIFPTITVTANTYCRVVVDNYDTSKVMIVEEFLNRVSIIKINYRNPNRCAAKSVDGSEYCYLYDISPKSLGTTTFDILKHFISHCIYLSYREKKK